MTLVQAQAGYENPWPTLATSDVAPAAKAELNATTRALDEQSTDLLLELCRIQDGATFGPDVLRKAESIVAAIRSLPLLV